MKPDQFALRMNTCDFNHVGASGRPRQALAGQRHVRKNTVYSEYQPERASDRIKRNSLHTPGASALRLIEHGAVQLDSGLRSDAAQSMSRWIGIVGKNRAVGDSHGPPSDWTSESQTGAYGAIPRDIPGIVPTTVAATILKRVNRRTEKRFPSWDAGRTIAAQPEQRSC